MNLSRRNLLLGAAATVVAPALPAAQRFIRWDLASGPDMTAVVRWIPNPPAWSPHSPLHEIYYGGAAGGGKMLNITLEQVRAAYRLCRKVDDE